jgi:class I fructose-bisphosphate aldolase
MASKKITEILGDKAEELLNYKCKVDKSTLTLPSPTYIDDIFVQSDRNNRAVGSLQQLMDHGRLGGTGYCSIFPVDQGIEHSAGASFAPDPIYFDPENIVKLAIEGGCNGVAYHIELLSYPTKYDQTMFGSVETAYNMGAVGVGATVYWGSHESTRQLQEVSLAFERAHELGMCTILWCYVRNEAFKVNGVNYETSADLTGQANHLGVTLQADIIKQKMATNNGGYNAVKFGKTSPLVYENLTTDHPIDLCRYQVLNCYSGKIGLINSGGESKGASDFADAVTTAVINKRAGGMGLIMGRKAFQKPFKDGVELLNATQDVYLDQSITIA